MNKEEAAYLKREYYRSVAQVEELKVRQERSHGAWAAELIRGELGIQRSIRIKLAEAGIKLEDT